MLVLAERWEAARFRMTVVATLWWKMFLMLRPELAGALTSWTQQPR